MIGHKFGEFSFSKRMGKAIHFQQKSKKKQNNFKLQIFNQSNFKQNIIICLHKQLQQKPQQHQKHQHDTSTDTFHFTGHTGHHCFIFNC